DGEAVTKEILGRFKDFIDKAKVDVISEENVSIAAVFEKYFARKAPFGDAKKKSEFPDAFVVAALRDWCEKEKTKMFVVSDDPDMEAACGVDGFLIDVKTLEEF